MPSTIEGRGKYTLRVVADRKVESYGSVVAALSVTKQELWHETVPERLAWLNLLHEELMQRLPLTT